MNRLYNYILSLPKEYKPIMIESDSKFPVNHDILIDDTTEKIVMRNRHGEFDIYSYNNAAGFVAWRRWLKMSNREKLRHILWGVV